MYKQGGIQDDFFLIKHVSPQAVLSFWHQINGTWIHSFTHQSVDPFVHCAISPCSPNTGEGSWHGEGDQGQADHGAQENGRGQQ